MMRKSSEYLFALLIFLFTLAVRLYFSFQSPFFNSDDSFFHYRQILSIKETGFPIFSDVLSYGGRTFVFSPVFDYIYAAFSFIFDLKVVENIFASSLVIFIFVLARFLTQNPFASLLASFASGFIPVFFKSTVNSVAPLAVVVPLFVFLIYCFFRINSPNWVYFYVVFFIFLSFLHPLFIVFVLGIIFYVAFIFISKSPISKAEMEVCLFSLFFNLWVQFLLYKKVFLVHGFGFVWQNIPKALLSRFFSQITIFDVLINIGILVFFSGLYVLFVHVFNQKNKNFLFIAGLVFAVTVLLMLRLVELSAGLSFFGVFFILFFAGWFSRFHSYVEITKFSFLHNKLCFLILIILFFSSFLPSVFVGPQLQSGFFEALLWLEENSPLHSVVAADVDEGHMISAVANRRNVVDSFFLLQSDVEARLKDIENLFASRLSTEAVDISEKYGISHILLSANSKKKYGVAKLDYVDGGCFREIFKNQDAVIYEKRSSCRLRVVE